MGVCVQQHFDIGHSLSFEVCFTLIIEWRSQRGATPQQQYGNPLYIYICIYLHMCVCSLLPFMSDVTTTVDCSSTPCHSAHTHICSLMANSCIASDRRCYATLTHTHTHTQLAAVLYVHTISCYSATVKLLDYF